MLKALGISRDRFRVYCEVLGISEPWDTERQFSVLSEAAQELKEALSNQNRCQISILS